MARSKGATGVAGGAGGAAPVTIDVPGAGRVSGLWREPAGARGVYALAHGAGAGMTHVFLETMAAELAARGVATLRFQFPYMEAGKRGVDRPPVAHATVRAAVAEAARRRPDLPLVAGGKSFGGRMTSQAQAAEPLPGVVALAFLGFPLHPPGKPGTERAAHLADVRVPMLFLQGTKDEFAELPLLRRVCTDLGPRARLLLFDGADHSFKIARAPTPFAALADALGSLLGGAGPL